MSVDAVSSPKRLVVILALAVIGTWCLATQAHADVYWAGYGEGSVQRSNADASEVNSNFIPGGQSIYGIAVDGSHVYWINEEIGTIGRANLDGTDVDQNFITGLSETYSDTLAVGGGHIYWSSYYGERIGRANLDGTEVEEELITGIERPYSIAVQGEHLYWSNLMGNVSRADLDGTDVEPEFIAGVNAYYGLAVDAEHIYWTTYENDSIGRADLDGENVNEDFITGLEYPAGIAVDSKYVYWTNTEEGIFRANLDGTAAQQIVPLSGFYYVLAADVSQPTLSNVASPGTTLGAGTITDTATLAGATGPTGPTGTLTFRLYGPGDEACTGSPAYTDVVDVDGNGSYSPAPFTPTAAGSYRWTVSYSGDYLPLTTECAATTGTVDVKAAAAAQPSTTAGVTTTQATPDACTAVSASAGTFVPTVKPGKVVAGVRAKVKVSTPAQLTVAPTLTYAGKGGKNHSVPLASLSFQSGGVRKLRMALPASLRQALPVGSPVRLSLRISAVANSSPHCTSPSLIATKSLKVKVVKVLVSGQSGVS